MLSFLFVIVVYKMDMARAMTMGMVRMEASVVPLTMPTERSTSRLNLAANMVTMAATGAEAAVTRESIMV